MLDSVQLLRRIQSIPKSRLPAALVNQRAGAPQYARTKWSGPCPLSSIFESHDHIRKPATPPRGDSSSGSWSERGRTLGKSGQRTVPESRYEIDDESSE